MAPHILTRRHFLAHSLAGASLVSLGFGCATRPDVPALAFSVDDLAYGDDPHQRGELRFELGGALKPVAVLIHGGYWQQGFDRQSMTSLAEDLTRLGYATWNIDYRRVGDVGGGFPNTLQDVGDAIDLLDGLAEQRQLDLSRVVVIGHSAGGQLALWSAGRHRLDAGAPGADPVVRAAAAVSLSGVNTLEDAVRAADPADPASVTLAEAVTRFLGGGPDEVARAYEVADPAALLPLDVPQLLVHGEDDRTVPIEHSDRYAAAAARAGDDITFIRLPKVTHFDVIKANDQLWDEVTDWLPTRIGVSPTPA
ncbi:MAG: alpha/beta hydrolase [Acidimicrobiales bacterium]|nr:alpha/beta hydrolase [Acidimicrobiales bacterium]